jgi:4-oxalocrotonate tautomerase
MPLLTLHVNRELGEVTADIARGLAELTVRILRKDPAKIVLHVMVDNQQACWYVNGARVPAGPTIIDLSILITKGTNSDLEKGEWIAAAWRLLAEAIGPLQGPNYISIQEIDAMNWGYDGLTQHHRSQRVMQS